MDREMCICTMMQSRGECNYNSCVFGSCLLAVAIVIIQLDGGFLGNSTVMHNKHY